MLLFIAPQYLSDWTSSNTKRVPIQVVTVLLYEYPNALPDYRIYCKTSPLNTRVTDMETNVTRLEVAISWQIKVELVDRKMEQQDLADAVGIERATLSRYMNNRRPMPMAVFFKIAEVLGLSPRVLMERAEARIDRQEVRTA